MGAIGDGRDCDFLSLRGWKMKMVLLKVASRSRPLPAVVRPLLWKIHQRKGWYCADDKSGGWSTPLVFLLPSRQPEFGPPSGRVVNVGSSVRSPSRTERWEVGLEQVSRLRAWPITCARRGCSVTWVDLEVWTRGRALFKLVLRLRCCVFCLGRLYQCRLRRYFGRLWRLQCLWVWCYPATVRVFGHAAGSSGACAVCGRVLAVCGWWCSGGACLCSVWGRSNFPLWYVCGHACPRTGACMPLDVALGSCRWCDWVLVCGFQVALLLA